MASEDLSSKHSLAYTYDIQDFRVGNVEDERRLRALVGVRIGTDTDAGSETPKSNNGRVSGLAQQLASLSVSSPTEEALNEKINRNLEQVSGAGVTRRDRIAIDDASNFQRPFIAFFNVTRRFEKTWAAVGVAVRMAAKEVAAAKQVQSRRPKCVVLVSTRMEAAVLFYQALNLCFGTGIRPRALYGTQSEDIDCPSYDKQRKLLLNGSCDLLIVTPGRFFQMRQDAKCKAALGDIRFVCLEEAQLFISGMWNQDKKPIYEQVHEGKLIQETTSILAIGSGLIHIVRKALRDSLKIEKRGWISRILAPSAGVHAAQHVQQHFTRIQDGPTLLRHAVSLIRVILLGRMKTMVFLNSLETADEFHRDVIRELEEAGVREPGRQVGLLTRTMGLQHNESAFAKFSLGSEMTVLIGTHGLAISPYISNVTTVIHIALPFSLEDHNIRLGYVSAATKEAAGTSLALVQEKDQPVFKKIAEDVAAAGTGSKEVILRALRTPSAFEPVPQKPHRAKRYNPKSDKKCYECGSYGHFRVNCPLY
ncbi:hypothetical protein NA57DRAFT_73984 [Rhizodiscina lignyota]|uniref:ATP-dependent RNA helicase n=1 Tax=Rhizodiscina lignyota TaxID=1504668 RepID=A0A9P4IJE1_9PEZI|nr:hypothetical protein NA57DRAFT_73984 [Rhizodiscina lignyota]